MGDKSLFGRFNEALMDWLRADSGIATETGHTASDNRIFVESGDSDVRVPSLVAIRILQTPLQQIEASAFYEATVDLACRATSRAKALDIAGAVEQLARPKSNTLDKAFSATGVETRSVRSTGAEDSTAAIQILPTVYEVIVTLVIVWVEPAS